jgi:hypothetical protein
MGGTFRPQALNTEVSWVLWYLRAEHKLWLKVNDVLNSTVNTVSSYCRIPYQAIISLERQKEIFSWMYHSRAMWQEL